MSIFDPPSDPFYVAHPCCECGWEMEKEWKYSLERICVNPDCENSTRYNPEKDLEEEDG